MQQSQEKIARLEQEKEHWLLEAQLGKVRLEKENQRIADLESQLAAALGGGASPPTLAAAASPAPAQEEAEVAAGKEATLCTSLVSPAQSSGPRSDARASFGFVVVVFLFFFDSLPHKTNTGLINFRLGGVLMWQISPRCCRVHSPDTIQSRLCCVSVFV